MSRKAVERVPLVTDDGCELQVAHFHPFTEERGIVLVPPLIGGSYILFGRQFRPLMKAGYRIVSYNYRGHRPSGGSFDLKSFFRDGEEVVRSLKAASPHLPLAAIGNCSGSMPLLDTLSRRPGAFDALVFVNAIHHIWQAATPLEAIRLYGRARGIRPPRSVGDAVSAVLEQVFPEIDMGEDHFGILPFDHVEIGSVAKDYLFASQPRVTGIRAPTLCIYGEGDKLLGLEDEYACAEYRAAFARSFADVRFTAFQADHFMTGLKDDVAGSIRAFLDQTCQPGRSGSSRRS